MLGLKEQCLKVLGLSLRDHMVVVPDVAQVVVNMILDLVIVAFSPTALADHVCPDWLLSSRGAQMWVRAFGWQGARWFYMVVGVALLIVAAIGLCRL